MAVGSRQKNGYFTDSLAVRYPFFYDFPKQGKKKGQPDRKISVFYDFPKQGKEKVFFKRFLQHLPSPIFLYFFVGVCAKKL